MSYLNSLSEKIRISEFENAIAAAALTRLVEQPLELVFRLGEIFLCRLLDQSQSLHVHRPALHIASQFTKSFISGKIAYSLFRKRLKKCDLLPGKR